MKSAEKKCWKDILEAAPAGVLTNADRLYVEVAAELLAMKRQLGIQHMDSTKLNRLETMLGKLGLNPADRSRVSRVSMIPESNPFFQHRQRPKL
ncbi:MAG TPA: hypothetical protein VEY92_05705 [Pseudoxanthomonas sp.]|nr:hypothetical protein [Pseudoxanthomonas sp.]